MALERFLAMTAAEYGSFSPKSPIAWMACHFSPYGLGLCNLPESLPDGSILIVDDCTPMCGQDAICVGQQLISWVTQWQIKAVLLDFQRTGNEDAARLVSHLSQVLPCPLAVSQGYASYSTGPVFLPPVPPSVSVQTWMKPWQNREIWLDMALTGETITVTEEGSSTAELFFLHREEPVFHHEGLHCHYCTEVEENCVRFLLHRTPEDLHALLKEAERLGVTTAVGLYQELHSVGKG